MVKYGPRIPYMVLKGKNGPKMLKLVLNGLQWSQMVPNGLKKINHKFNCMAFITRFNLILVWSKIVQILTKKSSQWFRHNQVSWSSCVKSLLFAVAL